MRTGETDDSGDRDGSDQGGDRGRGALHPSGPGSKKDPRGGTKSLVGRPAVLSCCNAGAFPNGDHVPKTSGSVYPGQLSRRSAEGWQYSQL